MIDIQFVLEPEDIEYISNVLDAQGMQREDLVCIFHALYLQGKPATVSNGTTIDDIAMADFDFDFENETVSIGAKTRDVHPDPKIVMMGGDAVDVEKVVAEADDFETPFTASVDAEEVAEAIQPEVDEKPAGWDDRVPRPTFDPEFAARINPTPQGFNPQPEGDTPTPTPTFNPQPEPARVEPQPEMVVSTPAPEPTPAHPQQPPVGPVNRPQPRAVRRAVEEPSFDHDEVCTDCGGFDTKVNPHSDPNMNCNCGNPSPYDEPEKPFVPRVTTPEPHPAPERPSQGGQGGGWSTGPAGGGWSTG